MEQEPGTHEYEPVVLELGEAGQSGIDGVGRREKLSWIVGWLFLFQFLVGPLALLRNAIPPSIGFGQFSIAVDIRYVFACSQGICWALVVLIPFLLAWSPRAVGWRVLCCAPMLALACFVNVLVFLFDMFAGRRMPFRAIHEELFGLSFFALVFGVGVAVVPLLLRAWRRVYVAGSGAADAEFGLATRLDWGILLLACVFVFFGAPMFDAGTGIGVLSGAVGMAVGVVASGAGYWFLREKSTGVLSFGVLVYVLLFVVLPSFGVWLADFVYFPALPAGSGVWFVGFLAGALVLLLHLLLLRAIGYRVAQPLPRSVSPGETSRVVDPFSD